ncbi:Lmp protein [Metamycoplasma hominis]|uniref:Lmp protein n=1 Tax=Metamycoplasma hominis TaxID=2098 RepID=UPI0022AA4138|nr:Lmp protein [Metamycoplasma hominis]MCZ2781419.1 Lmp protein [Metamycoplasma hominis]
MIKKRRRKLGWLTFIAGGVAITAFVLIMCRFCKKPNKQIKDRTSLNLFNKAQSELKELINSPIAKLCQTAIEQKVLNDSNKINEKSTDEEISKNTEYLNSSIALLKNKLDLAKQELEKFNMAMFQLRSLVNNKDSKSIDTKNSINALNNAKKLPFNSIEQVKSESLTLKNNIDELKLKLKEVKKSRLAEAKNKLKAIIDSEPSKYVDSSGELQTFNDSNVEAKSTLEDIDKKIDAAIRASNDLNEKIQNYKSTRLSDLESSRNDLSNFIANDLKDPVYKEIADKINEKIKEVKGVGKNSTIKELQVAIKTLADAKEKAIKEKAWIDRVGINKVREIRKSRILLVDAEYIAKFLKSQNGERFRQENELGEFLGTKFLKLKNELERVSNLKDLNSLDSVDYKVIWKANKELEEFIPIINGAIKQFVYDNFKSWSDVFSINNFNSWAEYCYPPKYTGAGEKLVAFRNEVQQKNEELRAKAKDAKWMDILTIYNPQSWKLNTSDIRDKFREVYITEEAKKNNLAYQAVDLLNKLESFDFNNSKLNKQEIKDFKEKLSAKNLEIEEYLSSEKTFENYRIYNPSLWMNDLNWKIKEQEKILNDINSKISSIKESSFTNKEFKNTFVELKQKLSILNKN